MSYIIILICCSILCILSYNSGYSKGFDDGKRHFGQVLISFSYWMTQYRELHNALYIIGRYVRKSGCFSFEKTKNSVYEIGNMNIGNLKKEEQDKHLK